MRLLRNMLHLDVHHTGVAPEQVISDGPFVSVAI